MFKKQRSLLFIFSLAAQLSRYAELQRIPETIPLLEMWFPEVYLYSWKDPSLRHSITLHFYAILLYKVKHTAVPYSDSEHRNESGHAYT